MARVILEICEGNTSPGSVIFVLLMKLPCTDNCNCNTDKVHPDRNTSDAIGVGVKTKTCYGWSECNGIPMSVDLDYFCLPNKDKHARQAYLLS